MEVACTECGATNPAGQRFCGQCAAPLPPSPGNATLDPQPNDVSYPFGVPPGATPPFPSPPTSPMARPGAAPPPPDASGMPTPLPAQPPVPRERVMSPMLATALIALAIILALAVVGVIAGQSLGS